MDFDCSPDENRFLHGSTRLMPGARFTISFPDPVEKKENRQMQVYDGIGLQMGSSQGRISSINSQEGKSGISDSGSHPERIRTHLTPYMTPYIMVMEVTYVQMG